MCPICWVCTFALLVGSAAAIEIPIEWKIGMSTNAQSLTMTVSDTAEFVWTGGHNVFMSTNKAAYDSCSRTDGVTVASSSPYTYTPSAPGVVYFICEVPGHCGASQKITITVTDPSNFLDNGGDGDDSESSDDSPCFSGRTLACRRNDLSIISPLDAYTQCWGNSQGTEAERVALTDLRAGDVVLDTARSWTRVVVNEHVAEHSPAGKASMLTLHYPQGSLTVTPDHYIRMGESFAPASDAIAGGTLHGPEGQTTISRVEAAGLEVIVNPITTSGTILAADPGGLPVEATTFGGWIAPQVLGSWHMALPLAKTMSYLFPATAQAFHDALVEPFLPSAAGIEHLKTLVQFAVKYPGAKPGMSAIIDISFTISCIAFAAVSFVSQWTPALAAALVVIALTTRRASK